METFIDYCKTGNIDMIKKIPLKNFNLDHGFSWACYNGHYNVVRYLIGLYKIDPTYKPINIHVNNEQGFRWACVNGHHNIVKYLMNLYKKHKYKPIKNYLIAFKKFDKYIL